MWAWLILPRQRALDQSDCLLKTALYPPARTDTVTDWTLFTSMRFQLFYCALFSFSCDVGDCWLSIKSLPCSTGRLCALPKYKHAEQCPPYNPEAARCLIYECLQDSNILTYRRKLRNQTVCMSLCSIFLLYTVAVLPQQILATCGLLGLNFGQFKGKEVITYTLLCFILFPPFVTPLYSSIKCQSRVCVECRTFASSDSQYVPVQEVFIHYRCFTNT